MDEYYRAIRLLPAWLAQPLARLPQNTAEKVHELRLRTGCGICLSIAGQQTTLDELPEYPARQDAGCPADGRDPLCALRRFSTYPSGRTGAGLPDHGIRLPCGGGRSVRIARPGGCCAAASFVAEFPHCASNLYGTSGGAVHPFAGTFHRGTAGGRTGQRQDHPSAADRPGTGCTETGRGCDRRARGTFSARAAER